MKTPSRLALLGIALVPALFAGPPLPMAKPEDVGISSERLQRVSAFVDRATAGGQISGAVTAVARHGKLVRLEAQGYGDLETRRALRTDDIFAMASMTKPIVTVGVLMLLEEQRLLLSDPVEKYLPEYRNLKVAIAKADAPGGFVTVPAERSITIHDLLIHRSGVASAGGPARTAFQEAFKSVPEDSLLADHVRALATVPLNFQPGARWEYGASTNVLGRIIEVISGQTLDVYLQQRILGPLGMVDTGFSVPAEKRSRLAAIYTVTAGQLTKTTQPNLNPKFLSATGGLFSTAPDYLRFCQMLLDDGVFEGKRFLSRKTIELMTARHSDPIPLPFLSGQYFGLGVAVQKADGDSGLISSPGTYGWSGAYNTYFRIDPKEQVIMVLLVQRSPANILELQYGFHNVVMQAIAD
ncbi:MAG TPA: serine hydrolase domain-containing protein [Opitutaceae bacterium]|nr:serine hydrolase domain-containing protein [Opitutaceae bacterium]